MFFECHGHIFMDGKDYKQSAARHKNEVDENAVRAALLAVKEVGIGYFRDGGDALGVSFFARELAPEYDIDYVTPGFAIHKKGHYGSIVGHSFSSFSEYRELLARAELKRADFVKIMFSGILDFNRFGCLEGGPLEPSLIKELVAAAHGEGFAVMAHCNGAAQIRAALEAGTDSIEHGYYMDDDCLSMLSSSGSVWVPTLAAAAGFVGRDGYCVDTARRILASQQEAVRKAVLMGCLIATGSDAGAFGVPHENGVLLELRYLRESEDERYIRALEESLSRGNSAIRNNFRHKYD